MNKNKKQAIITGGLTLASLFIVTTLNAEIEPLFTAQEAVNQLDDSNVSASSFKAVPLLFDALYVIPILCLFLTLNYFIKGNKHE